MSINRTDQRKVQVKMPDDEVVLTEQQHAKTVDIRNIMAKYRKTGMVDHLNRFQGKYGDFPDASDFHASMNVIAEANSMFESIPAHVRAKFRNDPAQFLDFIQDADNREEMIELGFGDEHLPPGS